MEASGFTAPVTIWNNASQISAAVTLCWIVTHTAHIAHKLDELKKEMHRHPGKNLEVKLEAGPRFWKSDDYAIIDMAPG